MANKKHLAIINQGTEAWNNWRDENVETQLQPNLSGANLSGINLQRAYLANTNFGGANLSGGLFYEANFSGANLIKADLRGANFSHADLSGARFNGARLNGSGTNLWKVVCNGTDFRGANLSEANLSEAHISQGANLSGKDTNFSRADLSAAYLCGSNLNGTNLSGVGLQKANLGDDFGPLDLREADLSDADLGEANLKRANLSKAVLKDAYLGWANLAFANLNGANLQSAIFEYTILGATDLTAAIGLESCIHQAPSLLDHHSIVKSGDLPLPFLRGCGIPEVLIKNLSSLINEVRFYSCFISYSSKNRTFAEKLYNDLQNRGVRCWFAPEDLKIGDRIRVAIDESILQQDKLLLILSETSVASDWVEKEVETAMEQERTQKRVILVPIQLDNEVLKIKSGWPADIRRTRFIGDFTEWESTDAYQKSFERLLRALKAEELK